MTAVERVKVTHTLSRATRDRVRELVASGAVRDASTFIEEALQVALQEQKRRHLALELAAFDDPALVAEVAALGDEGLEDIAAELPAGIESHA